jgi:HAD superfamily hydrolase (TIGR01509 family)
MTPEKASKPSIRLPDSSREIEAVLFDMDGVLVDSVPIHIAAWNHALGEHDLPKLERSTYLAMLGRTNMDMITRYAKLTGKSLPLSLKRMIIDTKEKRFREIITEGPRTTPGVMDWLGYLKNRQIRCSIASSGEMANIVAVLQSLHIADHFLSIISGARLPASKPDPTIFLLAAASLGVEPEKCMVIEDAPAGVEAARSANMLSCAVATSFTTDALQGADIVLNNLAQVDPETFFQASQPRT